MSEKKNKKILKKQTNKISKLLPYPKKHKQKLLNNYNQDMMEEFVEKLRLPNDFLHEPRKVAENLYRSKNWPVKDASLKKRAFAYIIDLILSLFFSIFFLILYFTILGLYNPKFFQTERSFFPALTIFIVTLSVPLYTMFFYPIILEGLYSKTIGKKILGLIVVNEQGVKITWIQAIVRSLTKLFPLLLIFETFTGSYQQNRAQRVMDQIANTRVIELTKESNIDQYISKVRKMIPNHKKTLIVPLTNLKNEIEEAMKEEQLKDPVEVFGHPSEIAKNILHTNNLLVNRNVFVSRVIAYCIDLIISIVLGVFILLIPAYVITNLDPNYFRYMTDLIKFVVFLSVASIPIYALIFYPILMEGLFSQTIGKKFLNLWTIDESGIKISWNQAVTRSMTKFLPILLVFEIIYMMKEGKTNRRILDKISRTMVVKIN